MKDCRYRWLARFALHVGVCCIGLSVAKGASEPASRNLATAKGTVVSASSEVGRLKGRDHTAKAAVDGQIGPGYWATAFSSKGPHWLEIKFAGQKRFNEVVLYAYERSRLNCCQVERWDGKAWVAVGQMKSAPPPASGFSPAWEFSDSPSGCVRCRFPAVSSDRVRLWFEKDNSVRLYEVQVLAADDEVDRLASARSRLDGKSAMVRVAFGRREGGTPQGWLGVEAGSRYDPERGIGWVAEGPRVDCDRHGGATFARGFVAGWKDPGRLQIDLPPGRYVAAVFSTDFVLPVRPFRVEGAGLQTGRPLATATRGAWDVRRFRVKAGSKGIELTLRAEVAWLVNALLIAPESNLDALLSEADRLEEQLALGSPEWMTGRKTVDAPAPQKIAAGAEDQSRGYVLFTNDLAERIYPYSRPESKQIGRPVSIEATPGEAGAASLGVVPLRAMFDMRLVAGDLAGPGGVRIPSSAVDLRVVRCWPQTDKTPAGRGKIQVVPELIEAQERHAAVCSPQGTTRQYWITVRVPDSAVPGQYRGSMQFTAEGVAPAKVDVELTVLPFRLQTPPAKTFFMYGLLRDFSDAEILRALGDMRAHGMNSLASDMVGVWRRDGKKPEFDPESLRHVLRLAKQAGMTRPMPWSAGGPVKGIKASEGSAEWNAALAELLRQVHKVQQEVGGQELLFYPVDEPFGIEERLTLAERAMRVARQTGAMRTYCTPAEKDIARLGSLLDVRCYAIGSVTSVPAAAESTRQAGAAFWWYTNAARELPDVRRYLAGVWFWSTGADGQGYWVYQSRWTQSPAFLDLEGNAHAHDYVAYPDVDGLIPTIQWECIRMGIDDARYLYTLEAAIAARRGTPQAAAAENFLASLRKTMPESTTLPNGSSILYDCPWQASQFTELRKNVIQHILALTDDAHAAR
jgi:hypothetical protein